MWSGWCLGYFRVLLAGEIADKHDLWDPPVSDNAYRDFYWRITKIISLMVHSLTLPIFSCIPAF